MRLDEIDVYLDACLLAQVLEPARGMRERSPRTAGLLSCWGRSPAVGELFALTPLGDLALNHDVPKGMRTLLARRCAQESDLMMRMMR
jgi:hypothetical protein